MMTDTRREVIRAQATIDRATADRRAYYLADKSRLGDDYEIVRSALAKWLGA